MCRGRRVNVLDKDGEDGDDRQEKRMKSKEMVRVCSEGGHAKRRHNRRGC